MDIRKTKIVSTIGPSTQSKSMIEKMISAGMNVARINMSHYTNDFNLEGIVKTIRSISKKHNKSISIIMDLPGPKIRTDNTKIIKVRRGQKYTLGKGGDIPLNFDIEFSNHIEGAKVKIDDGKLSFKVTEKNSNTLITVKARVGGEISPKKGVNISGLDLVFPTVDKQDIEYAKMAINLNFDWIALSFVRSRKDRAPIDNLFKKKNQSIPLIAKIEKPEAVDNIDSIVESFEGILIARGDLGLEMELEEVPSLQKKIIKICNKKCKPVITATQMLESMINSPIPTRAEVSDVATAIYDGSDAIMLSGETAIGKFPLESIRMMKTISTSVERAISGDGEFSNLIVTPDPSNTKKSICLSAYQMAKDLDIKAMIIMTESGDTGNTMSSFRPVAPIISMTPFDKVYRRLSLSWGVIPVRVRKFKSTDQMLAFCKKYLIKEGIIKEGEIFIMIAGVPIGVTGKTNMIKVETL